MALTWGSYRETIRRSILKDNVADEDTGAFRWSDEELLDAALWGLNAFANHTAVASATGFEGDGTTQAWTLPSNLFTAESFDETGTVEVDWGDTNLVSSYLDPIKSSPLLNIRDAYAYGFYTEPGNPYVFNTRTRTTPAVGDFIRVAYYAYYDAPTNDNSVLNIPRWAEGPLAHLIGFYALSGSSLKTSFIRQWGARPDTGNPEHNPVLQQQQAFMAIYEREMMKYPVQQRKTTYRQDDRD